MDILFYNTYQAIAENILAYCQLDIGNKLKWGLGLNTLELFCEMVLYNSIWYNIAMLIAEHRWNFEITINTTYPILTVPVVMGCVLCVSGRNWLSYQRATQIY